MKLTIPKTFELAGRAWKVKRVGSRAWYGRCKPSDCTIELSGDCRNDQELMHTFLHELLHAVMHSMGNKKLFRDEFFIDGASALLLQALTTAK